MIPVTARSRNRHTEVVAVPKQQAGSLAVPLSSVDEPRNTLTYIYMSRGHLRGEGSMRGSLEEARLCLVAASSS